MNEKVFQFHGLDFKRVIIGIFLIGIATVTGFFVPILVFDFENPMLSSVAAIVFVVIVINICKKYFKVLWTVKIFDDTLEVLVDKKLKSRFSLSVLKKIHFRGWFHKKSYYLLRLTTPSGKLRIFLEGSDYTNITSQSEMKTFDELVLVLESYALKNKYVKKDLKKSFTHSAFRNYYYLQKQNI